jgi:uncharacterized repeat protein (TIGR02543 family)
MTADAKDLKRQGYTFGGWYAKSDCSDASAITTSTTFEDGVGLAGITASGDDAVTLTLYAKWNEINYTIKYSPRFPDGSTPSIADKTGVTWTSKGLLPAGYETLTLAGYDSKGWNTKADGTGTTVTTNSVFSDLYQALYGNSDNTKTEITLYGIWDQKTFTVRFVDAAGNDVTSAKTGLAWDDEIEFFNYAPSDGSKSLVGWKVQYLY